MTLTIYEGTTRWGSRMKYRAIWPKTKKHLKEYLAGLIAGDGQIEKKRITILTQAKNSSTMWQEG